MLSTCASKVLEARKSDADVVIFDRYIYDELANLPLNRKCAIWFVRLVLKFVPSPDIAYLIDADPVAAQARKPEYPLEFVRRNREAYLALARLSGVITIVGPDSIAAMKTRIWNETAQKLAGRGLSPCRQHSVLTVANQANISPGELIEP